MSFEDIFFLLGHFSLLPSNDYVNQFLSFPPIPCRVSVFLIRVSPVRLCCVLMTFALHVEYVPNSILDIDASG